jgi:hypothetical protein
VFSSGRPGPAHCKTTVDFRLRAQTPRSGIISPIQAPQRREGGGTGGQPEECRPRNLHGSYKPRAWPCIRRTPSSLKAFGGRESVSQGDVRNPGWRFCHSARRGTQTPSSLKARPQAFGGRESVIPGDVRKSGVRFCHSARRGTQTPSSLKARPQAFGGRESVRQSRLPRTEPQRWPRCALGDSNPLLCK